MFFYESNEDQQKVKRKAKMNISKVNHDESLQFLEIVKLNETNHKNQTKRNSGVVVSDISVLCLLCCQS
jgi:hypothetical protein